MKKEITVSALLSNADFCNEALAYCTGEYCNLNSVQNSLECELERALTSEELEELESFFEGHLDGIASEKAYDDDSMTQAEYLELLKEKLM